jgi:integrase
MRLGELRGLKWDCIDLDRRQITVKRTYCEVDRCIKETTKGKNVRRIPINSALAEVLIALRPGGGEYVLTNVDFHHLYRTTKRLARCARVRPIRFHDLRHTFASNFMMCGGNIYDLQRILGHSTIKMTERYSHLSPEHLAGKTEILGYGAGLPATSAKVFDLADRVKAKG